MPVLSKKIEAGINQQINHELSAAYHYLAMEAWFENANLSGFAAWMRIQSTEELGHAMKLFKFLLDRNGEVRLEAVEKPGGDFKSPRDVFARAAELERHNTRAIYELYSLALDEKDYATESHLKWFIDEQVEEERTFTEIEALLEIAGDNRSALLQLNKQMGERSATEGD